MAVEFTPNPQGYMELCKSAEMQAILGEAADKLCASANAAASGVMHTPTVIYAAKSKVINRTAVGIVHVKSFRDPSRKGFGLAVEAKYGCLKSLV